MTSSEKLPPLAASSDTGQYQGLNGPSYVLPKHSSVRYTLPPPTVLKPYHDTKAGGLETWPAHCGGQHAVSSTVTVNKDRRLVAVEPGRTRIIPKPRFLDNLEKFLQKELQSLGVSEVEPSELRLQAHREVFEYLIEDFKTYRPLLAAIKNEYEMMLASQAEQIQQLLPLKQMLVTVSEQCDQKIMDLREQENQDIEDLKADKRQLIKKIDQLREGEKDLLAQVEKLQDELAAEYLRYRDECDARKLLLVDINELRYEKEDAMERSKAMQEASANNEDPVTLKIALTRAREDEMAATKRLNDIVANYGDVIPRRDFEALQKQYQQLESKVEEMKGDYQKLRGEHDTLLATYKQVLQERDDYYYEYESLRNKALTPRPEWEKCADHIEGGITRWNQLSDGKKSNDLVDVVLEELSGGGGKGGRPSQYFDGRGNGEEVPKYLRYEGQVKNRHLAKRDCLLMVRDIWKEKNALDAENQEGKREPLADFVHTYLQRRFASEPLVIEWGYNLHDACQRYAHDERINTFFKILNSEADEEIQHAPLQIIAKLLHHLSVLDAETGNTGVIHKDDFRQSLQEFFSGKAYHFLGKDEESILRLVRIAETELDARVEDKLEYRDLFLEDDEGQTGPFLEEIQTQYRDERSAYVVSIKEALGDASRISADDLRKALTMVDPYIKKPDLDRCLCWVFNVPNPADVDSVEPLLQTVLIDRLRNGNVWKHSQFES